MLKFRSMVVNAESHLEALQDASDGNGVLFKMNDDPRVTRFGRFIRRYSIDELPQIINVLKGDMTLVGLGPPLPRRGGQARQLRAAPSAGEAWPHQPVAGQRPVRPLVGGLDPTRSKVQDCMILIRTARAVVSSSGAH